MTRRTRSTHALALVGAALVVFPPPVHAYLDPGTGSLVVQAVVAAIAAVGYTFRSYLARITSRFRRRSAAPSRTTGPVETRRDA